MRGNVVMACRGVVAVVAALAAGCSGTQVLRQAHSLEGGEPLLQASDSRISVALDAVVVRDGPGSWARHADWDEYRFRLRSASGGGVRLTRITLFDALGDAVESRADRGALIDASREIERRYQASGRLVRSGAGGAWTTAPEAAAGAMAGAAMGGLAGAATAAGVVSAGSAAAAGAAVVAVPVLIGIGVRQIVNNAQVGSELERRKTRLPLDVGNGDAQVVAFFPTVPLPSAVELAYVAGGAEQRLRVPTQAALSQLHVPRPAQVVHRPEPAFPAEAVRRRIDRGEVRAILYIDADGSVSAVQVIEASSEAFTPEARRTFRWYKYNPGPGNRSAEEVMRFTRGAPQ